MPIGAARSVPMCYKRGSRYFGLHVEAIRIMAAKYQFEPVFIERQLTSQAGFKVNGSYDLVRSF